jgi:DNA polymerase-3 subunit beta
MEFKVNPLEFKKVLELVVAATERDDSFLSNILISTKGIDELEVRGTKLDASVTRTCKAVVKKEGATCVNGEKILLKFKNLTQETKVKVESNAWLKIESGTKKSKLPALEAERFPDFPEPETLEVVTEVETLVKLLKSTAFAVTNEESRYNLLGVKLEVSGGVAKMVATDGGRIAYAEAPLGGEFNVFLPKKLLTFIAKLPKGELKILENLNHIFFQTEDSMLAGRKVVGDFPKYEQMVNFKTDKKVEIPFQELKSAFTFVNTTHDNKVNPIKFELTKNKLTLSTNTASDGEAQDELEVNYKNKDFTVILNSEYLVDFFSAINPDTILMYFTDNNCPIKFVVEDPEMTFVLMGMRN